MTSESIDALTESAEILFYRLLVTADDQGRFMASAGYLFSALYPLVAERHGNDPKKLADNLRQVAADCQQLAVKEIIGLYSVNGRQYGCFINWKDHQRIRNIRPKHPGPNDSDNLQLPPQIDDKLPQVAAKSARNPNPNPNPNPKEKKPSKKSKADEWKIELAVVHLFESKVPEASKLRDPLKTDIGMATLKGIRARAKKRKWTTLQPWDDLFEKCVASSFLMKQSFFCLHWIVKSPINMDKVEMGNYRNEGERVETEPEIVYTCDGCGDEKETAPCHEQDGKQYCEKCYRKGRDNGTLRF